MPLEPTYRIEPCLLDDLPAALVDVIAELTQASVALGARLHPASAASLAELVRVMNCYYSNLIEGHNTRPRDIERALVDDLDADSQRRDLQLEARAHIRVQREVDFVTWFCRVALDQVRFMGSLFELGAIEERLRAYVQDVLGLSEYAVEIPLEVLRRGELARGEAGRVTGTSARTARTALNALVHAGLLTSDTAKSPVRLHFSVASADVLFPRLYGGQLM